MGPRVVASPATTRTKYHCLIAGFAPHPEEVVKAYLQFKSLGMATGAELPVPPGAPGIPIWHGDGET